MSGWPPAVPLEINILLVLLRQGPVIVELRVGCVFLCSDCVIGSPTDFALERNDGICRPYHSTFRYSIGHFCD